MEDTPHGLEKYLTMLENVGEYFFISLLLGISVTLLVESWRRNLTYLLAAVVFGTLLGYGVMQVDSWKSFSVLATLIGTITGPATIAIIQKKTLFDVAKDLKDIAEHATNRHRGSIPPAGRGGDARRTLPEQGDPYDD